LSSHSSSRSTYGEGKTKQKVSWVEGVREQKVWKVGKDPQLQEPEWSPKRGKVTINKVKKIPIQVKKQDQPKTPEANIKDRSRESDGISWEANKEAINPEKQEGKAWAHLYWTG